MAKPDGESTNQTEQLLAEEEVQAFAAELERAITTAMQTAAASAPNAEARLIVGNVPLLAKTLLTHPTTIYAEDFSVEMVENPPQMKVQMKAALVVNLQDQADQVGGVVKQFLELVPPEFAQAKTAGNVDYTEIAVPDPSAPVVAVGQKDSYLIIAAGAGTFDEVVNRMGKPVPQWLTDELASLPVPRLSTFAYADMQAIIKLVDGVAGAERTAVARCAGSQRAAESSQCQRVG